MKSPGSAVWAGLCQLVLACGGEEAGGTQASAAEEKEARPWIRVSLGDRFGRLNGELRRDGEGYTVQVLEAYGRAQSQLGQVELMLTQPLKALVVLPAAPSALTRIRAACATRQVPLVVLARGENGGGDWVGVPWASGAREVGRAIAETLKREGVRLPRVVVMDDPVWPESKQRNNLVLDGMQEVFGSLEVLLRFRPLEEPSRSVDSATATLMKLGDVHAVLAGDPGTTRDAVHGYRNAHPDGRAFVVGLTYESEVLEAARAGLKRPRLLTYRIEDLARAALLRAAAEDAGLASEPFAIATEWLEGAE